MRLILEKEEIVDILSKHFDAPLDPEKVIIRNNPFEIEVRGLPLASSDAKPKKTTAPVLAAVPSAPEELPAAAPTEVDADYMSPAAVLAASKSLERELDQTREKRRSGDYTYDPPPLSEDEIK